ncbi:type II secretion system protein GspL [Cellvibrio sp. ARAG 10.3]|uniref:type II secretion system protein GspL n=1 Tax=Cellvibrio sp. ARAG 10.3 TaxID=3451358 RepID=UPI003F478932
MSDQLVLYINRAADTYRWCWLDASGRALTDTAGSGDLQALEASLGAGTHQAWLIVPGTKVITRELEYNEKEKKHLRNLLPFQLEDTVIGDVDRFHFALGPLNNGRVCVAYIEKAWLEQVFEQLKNIAVEVTHCWSAPLALPLVSATVPAEGAELTAESTDHWTLQIHEGVVMVRYTEHLGFSVDVPHARLALQMLLTAQERVDQLPQLTLRAVNERDLVDLRELLPPSLSEQVISEVLVDFWQFDYSDSSIDLCQGDFSQRLPIERWWRNWRSVAALAAVSLGVYIGVLLYHIHVLKDENLEIRRQIESVYRTVVPQGALVDAEKQLTGMARGLQPTGQSASAMELISQVLPPLSGNDSIILRSIQYSADTSEINLNLQANAFNSIEQVRTNIEQKGLKAELLSSSAQGEIFSARLKISKLN